MVQVTVKPVEFTPETKQLFRLLPGITQDIVGAYGWFYKAFDKVSEGIDYAMDKETVHRYGAIGYLSDSFFWFRRCETDLDDALDKLRELVSRGLIREDISNYQEVVKEIKTARDIIEKVVAEISEIIDRLPKERPSEEKVAMIKKLMYENKTRLNDLISSWGEITYMYVFDPPEGINFGRVGNLVKVVAVGLGGLVVFGFVLSRLR